MRASTESRRSILGLVAAGGCRLRAAQLTFCMMIWLAAVAPGQTVLFVGRPAAADIKQNTTSSPPVGHTGSLNWQDLSSPCCPSLRWLLLALASASLPSLAAAAAPYIHRCCCCCPGSAPAGQRPGEPRTGELRWSGPQHWRSRQLTKEPNTRQHGGM